MAVTAHAMSTGYYATTGFTASTDKRDVSDMLDDWAFKDTPFLNRLTWGPDSGATSLEWISEHLGWGYIETAAAAASNILSIVGATDPSGAATSGAAKMISEGALLYTYVASDAEHVFMLVESITLSSTGAIKTITFEFLSGFTGSLAACTKLYILGNVVNEGSDPRADTARTRTILSNKFTILRKDVNITGTMAATDMYAVPDETRHQIAMRLLEMQREREMMLLYSVNAGTVTSSTEAQLINGVLGYLRGQSGDHIDTTTTTLTETAFNNMVAECWDNQGTPSVFVANKAQIRKFTAFDRARVRSTPDTKIGGSHITSYLTDIGIEIDLVPLRKVPINLGFVLDTSKIHPRAKRGRKLILEKLGKTGDYEQWQMISEFSMEMKGYTLGYHGMFSALT